MSIEPFSSSIIDASTTVGTSSTTLRNACSARWLLVIHNPSVGTNIAVNFTGGVAALNTAGSIMIAAGGTMYLDTAIPLGKITVIAASAATPVTCYVMERLPTG